jgi:hypothetical protein
MKVHRKSAAPAPAVAVLLCLLPLPDAFAAPWVTNGTLQVGRSSHSATLLLNGRLLIAGGLTDNTGLIGMSPKLEPSNY